MDFTGAYLTVICTVLLHFTLSGTNSLSSYLFVDIKHKAVIVLIQGLVFISYPLIGLLADIKLTRYRMICLSCWVLLVGHMILSIECIIELAGKIDNLVFSVSAALVFTLIIVGKGMFESTVIQFGTDQMIEASSAQLRTFIHWYYWSLYISNNCINVTVIGMAEYFSQCHLNIQHLYDDYGNMVLYLVICICNIQSILCCITLLLLYLKKFKNYFNIEPVGVNPIKQIVDVLKYAYHHKYPERRSALSYYRNTYPSRIDFGKIQYGGPFTNEEVEDTKTVLRLLVLLLSSFGFHLSNVNGSSSSNYVLYKSCPSSLILLYLIGNPSLFTDIITLFGIPVFHVLLKSSLGKYIPNIIKRMLFGILLLFLWQLVSLIISSQVSYNNCDFYSETKHSQTSNLLCYFSIIQYVNNTEWNTTDCVNICPSSLYTMDGILVWLLVPHILRGFGYMLVSVSVFEFICAQAPFRLKGFMIGIWYAMFSIKYIFVNIAECFILIFFKEDKVWIIYESIKIGIIGLSLVIFGISCRWYHYRERDEVVNVQGMIENIFEKELLQQQNEEESSDDESIVLITSSHNEYCTFN